MLATPTPLRYRRPPKTETRKGKAPIYVGIGLAFTVVAGVMLHNCLPGNKTVAQNNDITIQPL